MENFDIDHEIRRLVLAIQRLMPRYRDGGYWVPWRRVAREIEGTAINWMTWNGYAQLNDYFRLFNQTESVVKLSGFGIKYAENLPLENLNEIQTIAASVIRYAARLDPTSLSVEKIITINQVGQWYVHAVYVNLDENNISSETPVEFITPGGGRTIGKVIGQEPDGSVLYILFNRRLTDIDLPGSIEVDRGYLLSQLARQIRRLDIIPPLIQPILRDSRRPAMLIENRNSIEVANRLGVLPPPWSRLLWGPPGAGKTYALGHLITKLMRDEPGGKILIVAPSNRAIDVAVEQLLSQMENTELWNLVEQRKILRFGYPRRTRILEHPEILGPVELDRLNHQVDRLSKTISSAEQEGKLGEELAILRAKLLAAQEEIKNAVANHIGQCQVVATTVTLAYMESSPISQHLWNTVLVDEATMVTPAMCTFLASLAQGRLLFAGDPRQLGPVYENSREARPDDYEWMGRDIFDKSGVAFGQAEARQINTGDTRLARITSQRRCVPEVWSKVSHLYPEVQNTTEINQLQDFVDLPPHPGESVVLLDTAGNGACVNVHHSWQNQFTAELALEVALTIASESARKISIAIISPYRAQVNLLKRWIRQEQKANPSPYKNLEIETGTVHQFQGSDADVVIFDMVDGVGRPDIGYLLKGDTGLRLVNVAITRARAKLIILADKNWCTGAFMRPQNRLLWDLICGAEVLEHLEVAPRREENLTRQNNQTESPIEQRLYEALLKNGVISHVTLQHVIRDITGYPISRADFAFPAIKYAVYCDGKQWHLNANQWQRDWRQRNKLTENGWIFSVFTGREINQNPDDCANQVYQTYLSRNRHFQLG